MKRIRLQGLLKTPLPGWVPAAVCLVFCNACLKTAGGSAETGNPEIELALT